MIDSTIQCLVVDSQISWKTGWSYCCRCHSVARSIHDRPLFEIFQCSQSFAIYTYGLRAKCLYSQVAHAFCRLYSELLPIF